MDESGKEEVAGDGVGRKEDGGNTEGGQFIYQSNY